MQYFCWGLFVMMCNVIHENAKIIFSKNLPIHRKKIIYLVKNTFKNKRQDYNVKYV